MLTRCQKQGKLLVDSRPIIYLFIGEQTLGKLISTVTFQLDNKTQEWH